MVHTVFIRLKKNRNASAIYRIINRIGSVFFPHI